MATTTGMQSNQYDSETEDDEFCNESSGHAPQEHSSLIPQTGGQIRTHSSIGEEQIPLNQRSRTIAHEPQVLQPDNPLMLRFQSALKSHLVNQNKKLDEEIIGLELSMKESSKLYCDSVDIRDLEQQAVFRQNVVLDKKKELYDRFITDREKTEKELNRQTSISKDIFGLLKSQNEKEEELRFEKESLAALIKQFTEWEESQRSEITIAQRISEKNETDKKVYTQEKINQDLLLVRLTTEVLNLNTKFVELEKNIKQKQIEVETITQAVADGNVDLETLEKENKKLMQLWNHVILQVQQRDRVLNDLKTELVECKEQYRSLVCQVESLKRSGEVEIKHNEALVQTLMRLEGDQEALERAYLLEEDKQRRLQETLASLANMVDMTQRDLDTISASSKEKETKCTTLQMEIDKQTQIKYQLEEQIMAKLHYQVVLSKAEKQSTKIISNLRSSARQLETHLANAQNDFAKVLLLIEQENKQLKEQTTMIDDEKLSDLKRNKDLNDLELSIKHLETLITRKQCYTDSINSRLAEISRKSLGEDLTPDELQITSLEKCLMEINSNIEELHTSWMREQSRIVKLTQQRNALLNKLNIYNKQVLVMKQKQLKTEFEIDHHKKEEINMTRQLHSLEKRLSCLNLQCCQRNDYKESLDNHNQVIQNQLICDLKDAEVKALTVQEEMCYLEIDKEELKGEIAKTQRDFLAWEKKLQMVTEVKLSIEKAKAEGGEIAVMKSEIHRMEVRYAQLVKVQEKLAHDMEMCISRRDGIVELAYAREKRSTKQALYTRQQFQKNLDDLQAKIRQINLEIKLLDKSYKSSEEHFQNLSSKEQLKKNQLTELQKAVSQMQSQLSEGHLHRQKNLELLVRKQRKARQYGDLKVGRFSLLYRQESALELETQKQKTINSDLSSIVESLNTDFPSLETSITQVLNTLHSPAA